MRLCPAGAVQMHQYPSMGKLEPMQEKVIITCALTGAGPLSSNPNQPVTPKQIAESGLAAAEAGAAILHVHVRDPETSKYSGALELYEEVVERIREQNKDVILNL